MTRTEAPTLEDLRTLASAAWLWDGARGRIVWANPAGVAYFGGESVFDLIDRPFCDVELPDETEICAHMLRSFAMEAGITLHNVRRVADTGVDRISVGALTHSAVALSLKLERVA